MAIPGFVVHLDQTTPRRTPNGDPVIARTEADFVAVRFPYSKEIVGNRPMTDDPQVVRNVTTAGSVKVLFILAEVKASQCGMNGPWTNQGAKNMQRVLRRMGFTSSETAIQEAADGLYGPARWEGNSAIVQYVCFGSVVSSDLDEAHADLVQITWDQIGAFLFKRHLGHPEKTPGGLVQEQWPSFGKAFGKWFVCGGQEQGGDAASRFVAEYVSHGARSPR